MTIKTDIISVVNKGKSPVILTGPHNGWAIPAPHIDNGRPLGLAPHWFARGSKLRRHEACDWGVQDLFDEIQRQNSDICLLSAKYSRLLVDLNRIPAFSICEGSSETGEPIPGNRNLSDKERLERIETYYTPYHSAIDDLITDTRRTHGKVIWLDIHSFSPTWLGKPRAVGIGTLKLARSSLTEAAEAWLAEQFPHLFMADQPYDLSDERHREMSCGHLIAARNNLDYFGLEIRNDLLSGTRQISDMANHIIRLTQAIS